MYFLQIPNSFLLQVMILTDRSSELASDRYCKMYAIIEIIIKDMGVYNFTSCLNLGFTN